MTTVMPAILADDPSENMLRAPLPRTALRVAAIADVERAQPHSVARYARAFFVVHAMGASYGKTATVDKTSYLMGAGDPVAEMFAVPLAPRPGAGVGRASGVITVGRLDRNDVFFGDDSVSQLHALIRDDGAGFVIADAGSTNGTFVDGERVGRMNEDGERRLRGGEILQLGNVTAMFVDADGLLIVAGALS